MKLNKLIVDAALRKFEQLHGYQILLGDTCCQGCSYGFLEDKYATVSEQYVYYLSQSEWRHGFFTDNQLWLYWNGDGCLITSFLRAEGFTVEWGGSETDAICIRNTPDYIVTCVVDDTYADVYTDGTYYGYDDDDEYRSFFGDPSEFYGDTGDDYTYVHDPDYVYSEDAWSNLDEADEYDDEPYEESNEY